MWYLSLDPKIPGDAPGYRSVEQLKVGNISAAPADSELRPAGALNAKCAMISTLNTPDRVIQQSNTDMESVLHLTLVWETITLAQTRQLYLIYKLPALSLSQTGTAGACSFNLQGLAWVGEFDYIWRPEKPGKEHHDEPW